MTEHFNDSQTPLGVGVPRRACPGRVTTPQKPPGREGRRPGAGLCLRPTLARGLMSVKTRGHLVNAVLRVRAHGVRTNAEKLCRVFPSLLRNTWPRPVKRRMPTSPDSCTVTWQGRPVSAEKVRAVSVQG